MKRTDKAVRQYDVFEKVLEGKTEGNPFLDYTITGTFVGEKETKTVQGFYDGEGKYIVRFMPSFTGEYSYSIQGDFAEEGVTGNFEVKAADKNNHGPVQVASKYHFQYADGTPYYSVGTTCYVWELQSDELIEKTLASLKKAKFNKIRFCVFPKHYAFNMKEPRSYPYAGTPMDSSIINSNNVWDIHADAPGNHLNFYEFNPEHFRHIETCIKRLGEIGVEADIIVFHPYDRWGFSIMTRDQDDLYVNYVINRFAAFHNVWWSMANEYDILKKADSDWTEIGLQFKAKDPYNHPRSIHHCIRMFDHSQDWITHVSFQRNSLYVTAEEADGLREKYGKPVLLDEIAYEGNIPYGWGNISGEEMVKRFWEGAMRGGYPGHGETYLSKDDILWWSHGGKMKGESYKRVAFLRRILEETPGLGLKPVKAEWDCVSAVPESENLAFSTGYQIHYYSFMRPSYREFDMKDGFEYEVEVIDTWNMTIKKVGVFSNKFKIELPGKPYMAIRMKKTGK